MIVIFGCGGHARSVLSTLEENENDKEIIFVDENAKPNERINGHKVVTNYSLSQNDCYHVAIGNNDNREKKYSELQKNGIGKPLSIISRHAIIRENTQIGQGVFVSAMAYIGPNVCIGNNTIINTGSIIEHESIVGDDCHIAPGSVVCGRTKLGNNVMLGAGSTVINKIEIFSNVMIGAGAVVVENIKEKGTYIGAPARKIHG